ncbi:MAG: methylenetetrahydrofolate reductase [Alphaproteobacteria bacterium]|nr:methylenetetrahydrofolate reductase [Alphaproteobacteria bacterium]
MTVTREQVISLLSGFSVEVTPASAAKVDDFSTHLSPGTTVNVTFLPGSDIADTIAICARLRREGFNPVAHVAARSLESTAHLERYLDGLASEAQVDEVLVIGGGVDKPVGPYATSMQVLSTGLLDQYGMKKIGVAGHPEGSPDILEADIRHALAEKNAWARDSDAEVYIETQFCFEADLIAAWERRIRAEGNMLPIHIGLPGLATLKTLIKFAQMSGVGPSIRVLTRQARNIAKLLVVQEPDLVVAGLAEAVANDPDSLLTKVHFYPFGGLAKTAAWLNTAAAGQIRVKPKGGFDLLEAGADATPLRAVS